MATSHLALPLFTHVLYGRETWFLTIRGEEVLRVFENRVLGKIFGPKREEVTGGWRRLHNEELHNLYASPNIIRDISQEGRNEWGMWHSWER
jgi:hypothetical protein